MQSFNPRANQNSSNNSTQEQFRRTNQSNQQRIKQTQQQQTRVSFANNKNIKLAYQTLVVVVYGPEEDITNQVKKVYINKLQDEHKKLAAGFPRSKFLKQILIVEQMVVPFYKIYYCVKIINLFLQIQILQLELEKNPFSSCVMNSIDSQDYLFFGDYVDKHIRSLEITLLLFTLKVKYNDQIHLLRGHYEDPKINKIYGFADECYLNIQRKQQILIVFIKESKEFFNILHLLQQLRRRYFVFMVVLDKQYVQLMKLNQQKLWSDPCLNDEELENQQNVESDLFQNKSIIRFGNNRINKFLQDNNLNMIKRSHESINEGFERQNNSVITVFSCSDYSNCGNKGTILSIIKRGDIIPKVIPLENIEFRRTNLKNLRFCQIHQYQQ